MKLFAHCNETLHEGRANFATQKSDRVEKCGIGQNVDGPGEGARGQRLLKDKPTAITSCGHQKFSPAQALVNCAFIRHAPATVAKPSAKIKRPSIHRMSCAEITPMPNCGNITQRSTVPVCSGRYC